MVHGHEESDLAMVAVKPATIVAGTFLRFLVID
jgi:hypothetical protein